MARLSIDQIKAPDFSVASQATARAGESIREAGSQAQDLLAKYQAGIESKADAELTNLLASSKSEEEWDAKVNSIDFSQMPISASMRQNIINRRDAILAQERSRADTIYVGANTAQVRADTASTLQDTAQTGRENAISNAAVDWDLATSGDQIQALISADQQGNYGGQTTAAGSTGGNSADRAISQAAGITSAPLGRPIPVRNDQEIIDLARTIQAEAGNQGADGMLAVGAVIANRVGDDRFGDGTINGVLRRPGAFSAWNSTPGADGSASYANGEQGQNMSFEPNELAMDTARRIVSGNYADPTNGATHYVNKSISNPSWASNVSQQIGDHTFGQADGPNPRTGNTYTAPNVLRAVGTPPAPLAGPNIQRALQQIIEAPISLAEKTRRVDAITTAATTGQGKIDSADALAAQEYAAALVLAFEDDPMIVNAVDRNVAVGEVVGANAEETVRLRELLRTVPVENMTAGLTGVDPAVKSQAEGVAAGILADQAASITATAQVKARAFDANPVDTLAAQLKGYNASADLPRDLAGIVRRLADDAGISEADAAASISAAAESRWNNNPFVGTDGWLTFFGNGVADSDALAYASEHFKGPAAERARQEIRDDQLVLDEVQKLLTTINDLSLRQQKSTTPNADVDRRLAAALERLDEFSGVDPTKASAAPSQAELDERAALELRGINTYSGGGGRNSNPRG